MAERRTSADGTAERNRILGEWDSRITAQRKQAEAEQSSLIGYISCLCRTGKSRRTR